MKIKNNVKCFISMIAIILYPSMFMYFHNMSEGHFIEILPSIGKNLILAVVLLVAFSVLFRNIRKAFLTSEIALLLFMNFNTILGAIKKIIPGMRKAYFFVIVAVILTIVFSVVKRKINEPENICTFCPDHRTVYFCPCFGKCEYARKPPVPEAAGNTESAVT